MHGDIEPVGPVVYIKQKAQGASNVHPGGGAAMHAMMPA